MSDLKTKFIKPLSMQFNLPAAAQENPEAWLAVYATILKPYDGDALERAAQLIMASRTKRDFPLAAECNSACLDAMKMLEIERRRGRAAAAPQKPDPRDWERRSRLADDLFAAHVSASLALKEEWWWRLWSWMQTNGRAPDIHELKKIRDGGVAAYQSFQRDIAGNHFAKALMTWRERARKRLADLVRERADA